MCPIDDDGVAAHAAEPALASPQCHDEVCITCSDQAVAVTVLQLLDDNLAVVGAGPDAEQVSVALVRAKVGDTILVHAGEAIAVVGGDSLCAWAFPAS